MKDQDRANLILQQARDILMQRLAERIIEAEEDIIEDARGDSFLSEIGNIYEQIGSRLANVNQMLGGLPQSVPEEQPENDDELHDLADEDQPLGQQPLALPAPAENDERMGADRIAAQPITFQTFAQQIEKSDLDGAGQSLAVLLEIDVPRARRCAEVFHQRLHDDPLFLNKAMRLRQELLTGSYNDALMLLFECFGLTGLESLKAMQTLKSRLMV